MFDFTSVLQQWPLLLSGTLTTLIMTLIATFIGIVLGIACGWVRAHGNLWLSILVGCYIELVRNTPYIVQLFFLFLGCQRLASSYLRWKRASYRSS